MTQANIDIVRAEVERLYRTNLRTGTDSHTGFQYSYLCPSPKKYHWQWFWDSCFHAVAMAHVAPEQAVAELRTLVAAQEPDGFMGHIAFWGNRRLGALWGRIQSPQMWRPKHTAMIQPPVLAQAVARVAEVISDAWLPVELMPALDKYHTWLSNHRVPDPDGLLVVFSPYETGTDYSPAFDEVLGLRPNPGSMSLVAKTRWLDIRNAASNYDNRKLLKAGRFLVKDVLVNSLYAESLATMARLHQKHGERQVANAYATRAGMVRASLVDKLWDRGRGAFYSLYGPNEQRTRSLTSSSLLPLVVEDLPSEPVNALVEGHLQQRAQFWLNYPVPSVSADEKSFSPRGSMLSWRGPSRVNINWMLWRGLKRHGFHDLAEQLAMKTVNMVARSGLREYYHPYTGVGQGAESFGWSGLALDMLQE
jgi:hypothetical protein